MKFDYHGFLLIEEYHLEEFYMGCLEITNFFIIKTAAAAAAAEGGSGFHGELRHQEEQDHPASL